MTHFADRGDNLPAISRRGLDRRLTRTDQDALVRARQVQADAFVGTVALHELFSVGSLASHYSRQDPENEALYRHIGQRVAIGLGNSVDGRGLR